ncbi:class I SAM-dependent methyltransferase [Alkalicoccobacillus porphyridii]|uniref:Protein-L-IsoD(D-D) O-methyltransferase n=1 Tax=Alkalicoccobacillus porphyridii TaxID=2597270 RepID=A0A553ZYM6_9BACI|nr:class I SAM-dependent methyltransferase [Alkalicoccobacillus porphyridii]TSB46486.1 protein-L-IsoD(D-D) O-methyltransferase [Alkalicoccobacillus porphyridii]
MIVTTARKQAKQLQDRAQQIAIDLDCSFVKRNDLSVSELINGWKQEVLVTGANRLSLYHDGEEAPFFYHPNAAAFRAKAFLKDGYDVFVQATGLKPGSQILDCTLGLAADAVIAKLAVGEAGRVTGIEAHPAIAYIVHQGLQEWQDAGEKVRSAMRSVEVISGHHLNYLKLQADNSYDVVYFDPMFEAALDQSTGIQALKQYANYETLSSEAIEEATRVAKYRVVLKDHWQSTRFDEWGFHVEKRRLAKFQYGIIEKKQR